MYLLIYPITDSFLRNMRFVQRTFCLVKCVRTLDFHHEITIRYISNAQSYSLVLKTEFYKLYSVDNQMCNISKPQDIRPIYKRYYYQNCNVVLSFWLTLLVMATALRICYHLSYFVILVFQ